MRLNSMRAMVTAIALGLTLVWGSTASAAIVTVDGGLSDWDVTPIDGTNTAGSGSVYPAGTAGTGTATAFTGGGPHTTGGGFTYKYDIEDIDDDSGHGVFLSPNYGGQDYDAEFLGAGTDAGTLYIAILTGQRPDNGLLYFAPGDIYIMTDNGVYGIEVGGGAGHSGSDVGPIDESAAGSYYDLFPNGTTDTHLAGAFGAGDLVYANLAANWEDAIASSGGFDVQLLSGRYTGYTADYVFTLDTSTNKHGVIELALDLAGFGAGNTITSIRWAPSCGNDLSFLQVDLNAEGDVPEPTSLALLVMGGLSFLGVRRFRKNV